MKKFLTIFLIKILLLFSCKSENELPNPSKEEKNTFGMKINGKIWTPSVNNSIFGPSTLSSSYFKPTGDLSIFAFNKERNQRIELFCYGIKKPGIYYLSYLRRFPSNENLGFIYAPDTSKFEMDDTKFNYYFLKDSTLSKVEITKIDTLWNIISGKFHGNFVNSNKEKLDITNGVFDLKFE
jgi:hypothetical protein